MLHCVELHVRRGGCGPSAMQYSIQSNCLVALDSGRRRYHQQGPWQTLAELFNYTYHGQIIIVNLGAGDRVLCRVTDPMCALPARAPAKLMGASRWLTCALHCAGETTSFTLLDGGSGNEVITGSVRHGEFAVAWPDLLHCRGPAVGAMW